MTFITGFSDNFYATGKFSIEKAAIREIFVRKRVKNDGVCGYASILLDMFSGRISFSTKYISTSPMFFA